MLLDDFMAFCDANEIQYDTTATALIFYEAPCCGDAKKLYLYKDEKETVNDDKPLFGKCHKCDIPWNSRSFLLELGYEHKDVDKLHSGGDLNDFDIGSVPAMRLNLAVKDTAPVYEKPVVFDLTPFSKLPEVPNHPASLYAIKRGWTEAQVDDILIDTMGNSVVYVCREAGRVVGFQRRWLKPSNPKQKTKSAPGFKKTQHVIRYPNSGDLMVCEGPATALSAWHYGYDAICTFGSGVSERQLKIIGDLAESAGKRVAVAFDLDKAGRKGYQAIRLAMYWRKIYSYRVKPEHGNDLNDSWMAGKGLVVVPVDEDDVTIPDLGLEDMQ